jgi:hypothetical protein
MDTTVAVTEAPDDGDDTIGRREEIAIGATADAIEDTAMITKIVRLTLRSCSHRLTNY